MLRPRHIVISVYYDRHPAYGRSLRWIAPELQGAHMTMTEDRINDPRPSRTWEGTVDGPTFTRFARAWRLPADAAGPTSGAANSTHDSPPQRHTLDGMNWEDGGRSPIVCVSVEVTPLPATGGGS
jgi:hypothetical protein